MKILIITGLLAFSWAEAQAAKVNLSLEVSGLSAMRGQHYEGWNIVGGEALSTGRFSIGKDGSVYSVNAKGKPLQRIGDQSEALFPVDKAHKKASLFVLTIEPNNDKDAGPSDVHIMGGAFSKKHASLSVDHGSSLGTNFSSTTGSFILAAPTGGDFNQGVWFVDPSKGKGSLDLPTLPKGWAYEGWIVNTKNGKKLSTGTFFQVDGVDSDAASFLAGPLNLSFPKVAGQDIVRTPIKLNDGKHAIVVTVEPYPDFDANPSDIKILKRDLSKDVEGMTPLSLENIAGQLPSGAVSFK